MQRVVCDLPFGRKFGTAESVAVIYPAVLAECERLLEVGGTAVLMTSEDALLERALTNTHGFASAPWLVEARAPLQLGALEAIVFTCRLVAPTVHLRREADAQRTAKRRRVLMAGGGGGLLPRALAKSSQ